MHAIVVVLVTVVIAVIILIIVFIHSFNYLVIYLHTHSSSFIFLVERHLVDCVVPGTRVSVMAISALMNTGKKIGGVPFLQP